MQIIARSVADDSGVPRPQVSPAIIERASYDIRRMSGVVRPQFR